MDYSNCCRLCLSKEGRKLAIFGSDPDGFDPLSVRISSYLSFEVSQFDCLPKQICHRCECQVNVWHYFKVECAVSQQKLKNWLGTLGTLSSPSVEREYCVEECGRVQEAVHIKLEPEEVELDDEHHLNNTDLRSISAYPACTDGADLTNDHCMDYEEHLNHSETINESCNSLKLVISEATSVADLNHPHADNDSGLDGENEDNHTTFHNAMTSSEAHSINDVLDEDRCTKKKSVLEVDLDNSDNDASRLSFNTINYDSSVSPECSSKSLDVFYRDENSLGNVEEGFTRSADALMMKKEVMALETEQTPSKLKSLSLSQLIKHKFSASKEQLRDSLGYNLNAVDLPKINNHLFDENTKTCKVCNKTYPRSNLWRHIKIYHAKEDPFRCDACRISFPGRRELVAHRIRTVNKSCRAGKKLEVNKSLLTVNRKIRQGKPGKYECCECKSKFKLLSSAKSHVRIHTGEKPFFCFKCNEKEFRLRKTALKHVAVCKGKRDHLTPFSRDNDKPMKQENHILASKENDKLVKFDSQKLNDKPVLDTVKRKVVKREMKRKVHKCGKCGKVFTNGVGISNHLRTECKKKCFSCSSLVPGKIFYKHFRQCFKSKHSSYTSPKILELMLSTSTDLQSSQSTTAENTAKSSGSEENNSVLANSSLPVFRKNAPLVKFDISLKDLMAKHLDTDGKLRSFTCQFCNRTMSNRKSLHSHLLKHSAKAFKCDLCYFTRYKRSTIEAHMASAHKGQSCSRTEISGQSTVGGASLVKPRLPGKFPGFLSKLKCDICLKSFSSTSSLMYHKLSHKRVKCVKCEITFPANMEKTHVCTPKVKIVSSSSNQEKSSHQGQSITLPEKRAIQYTCHLCKKKFHTRKMLYQHKKMHIKMKIYKCKMCGNSYSDAGALQLHKETDHSEELAQVATRTNENEVKVEDKSIKEQKPENAEVIEEKPWKCTVCHRQFTQSSSLYRHMKLHVNRPKKKLPLINKAIAIQKPSNPDLFCCSYCDKAFSSKASFIRHKGWHSRSESLAESSVKSEAPATSDNISEVSGSNNVDLTPPSADFFLCNYCPRKFTSQKSLKIHMFSHTKPKTPKDVKKETVSPGMNTHCGSFIDAKVVQADAENTKQEPLQCKLCNKEYRCKKSLKYHMMGHSGEKPYKCRSCSNQYSNPKNLAKHEKERHTLVLRPFCCNRCKTSFILKEDLLAHHEKCTH